MTALSKSINIEIQCEPGSSYLSKLSETPNLVLPFSSKSFNDNLHKSSQTHRPPSSLILVS